jgi:hypothetical protein
MNALLLAAVAAVLVVPHYLQFHKVALAFDLDPNTIELAAPIALALCLVGAGISLWRAKSMKRALAIFFGGVFGTIVPLMVVFGLCFVTVEYRYRAADSTQEFLTTDKPDYDFAREYHAINIHDKLQANGDAAVKLAELDRREKELALGIAIVRSVEHSAGIGYSASDTAVNQIEAAGQFKEVRAAQMAKLLSPEQVTRLNAIEHAACYIGHEVGPVKELNYLDCAFTEKNLLDLNVRLKQEYPLWTIVHNFVQSNVPSLTTRLLP